MKTFSIICSSLAIVMNAAMMKPDIITATHCLMPRPKLMAQEGNPGHHEPPPGWHCAHGAGDDKKEPCTCHRECVDVNGEDKDGNQLPTRTEVKEDAKCSSFCFKDHCRCGVKNCD